MNTIFSPHHILSVNCEILILVPVFNITYVVKKIRLRIYQAQISYGKTVVQSSCPHHLDLVPYPLFSLFSATSPYSLSGCLYKEVLNILKITFHVTLFLPLSTFHTYGYCTLSFLLLITSSSLKLQLFLISFPLTSTSTLTPNDIDFQSHGLSNLSPPSHFHSSQPCHPFCIISGPNSSS